ncbi:MRPS5 [Sanghuangporus sanghuang]
MSKSASLLALGRSARFALVPPQRAPLSLLPRHLSSSASHASEGSGPSEDVDSQQSTPADDDGSRSLFPDLMQPDVLYDSAHTTTYRERRTGRTSRVHVRNDPSFVVVDKELNDSIRETGDSEVFEEKDSHFLIEDKEDVVVHKYPLIKRRVTQMTGKGKIHRLHVLMVVGNGEGLLGYGEGKHDAMNEASNQAYQQAVRNMDYVERFEKRTIWTDMSIKFGSTRILMRPRPVGFGLHCNPNIHQVLKAAGIKDVSAKVWGSRNPINVIKATCMLIQSGNAPLSMGNGIGGKGRRLDAGVGMRSKESIERDRGRKLLDGRTW